MSDDGKTEAWRVQRGPISIEEWESISIVFEKLTTLWYIDYPGHSQS